MKKLILLMLGILLVLPLISASLGTFKQNDCVSIRTILNATWVNISTITKPFDSMPNITNKEMTKQGLSFNYTFCNTDVLGNYIYDYFSDESICGGGCENDFTITGTGTQLSTSQAILYFVFLIAAIGIFILCLYYAVKIPYKNQRDEEGFLISVNDLKYVKIFLIGGCYLLLLLISGLLRGITSNFIPEIGVAGLFEWIFWILLSFMYPIIVCGLIFALIIFLNDRKLTKALERGIPI